ncbi:MAG: hypothetical protein C0614_09525, partial [Desulfuromonas sp.]
MTNCSSARWQTIFKVGSEGGSLTVMAKDDGEGRWQFAMVKDEQTMKCLCEELIDDQLYSSACADSWQGVLKMMDKYPWTKLYPLQPFHDEFKKLIWEAVEERGGHIYRIDDWQ